MDNTAIKNFGPGSVGDLARMGGDIAANMTNATLKGYGPDPIADLARMGGGAIGPAITGTPVLTGTINVAYAGFTVSSQGGAAPRVYALVGTWPAGITVNSSTGVVSGTPTASGTFAGLSVKVTDASSKVDQIPTFSLVIAAA